MTLENCVDWCWMQNIPARASTKKMLLNLVDLERIPSTIGWFRATRSEALDINASADELRQQIITCHHTLLRLCRYAGQYHRHPATSNAYRLLQAAALDVAQLREILNDPYFHPLDTPLLSNCNNPGTPRAPGAGGG